MRKRERSFDTREPFNQSVPRESLWYYSEERINPSSGIAEEEEEHAMKLKSYKKMIQEKNHRLISKSAQRNTFKRDIAFVVDWEMSDIL